MSLEFIYLGIADGWMNRCHSTGLESNLLSHQMFVVLCSVVDFVRIHLDLQCKHVCLCRNGIN